MQGASGRKGEKFERMSFDGGFFSRLILKRLSGLIKADGEWDYDSSLKKPQLVSDLMFSDSNKHLILCNVLLYKKNSGY